MKATSLIGKEFSENILRFFKRGSSNDTVPQTFRAKQQAVWGNREWDNYDNRMERYNQLDLYYTNLQYDSANMLVDQLRRSGMMYTHTRPIYNPVYRLVNLYADKIYFGAIDMDTLTEGAVPFITESDQQVEMLKKLFTWSNWGVNKALYPRTAEKLGDVYLRVWNDTAKKKVGIEVIDPRLVAYQRKDAMGNLKEVWISYLVTDDKTKPKITQSIADFTSYTYTEVITGTAFKIYHDDKLVDEYPNPFGFVPMVHHTPMSEGRLFGSTRFNAVRVKIDEINSQSALLDDQIRKVITPILVVKGASLEDGLFNRSYATPDKQLSVDIPAEADIVPLTVSIDIQGVLMNIQALLTEMERDIPELFLHSLMGATPPSGVALADMFDLSVTKIKNAMAGYDDALVRALQMACTIGGVTGCDGFEGITLDSYAQGDLNFTIRDRPVLHSGITVINRLNGSIQTEVPKPMLWKQMGYSRQEIAEMEQYLRDNADEQINQLYAMGLRDRSNGDTEPIELTQDTI